MLVVKVLVVFGAERQRCWRGVGIGFTHQHGAHIAVSSSRKGDPLHKVQPYWGKERAG